MGCWYGRPSLIGNLALGPARAPLPGSKLREGSIDLNTPLRRTRTQAQVANTEQKKWRGLGEMGLDQSSVPLRFEFPTAVPSEGRVDTGEEQRN